MEKKIEKEMIDWLNYNSGSHHLFREISIKGHAHGVRVTLSEDYSEVATSVEESIADAFHDCLKNYDICKYNILKRKINDSYKRIHEEEIELERKQNQLKEDKKRMEECAKKADVKMEKILIDRSW